MPMSIDLSREAEQRLRERARAEGISIEAYLEQLIQDDADWGEVSEAPIRDNDSRFDEVRTAVMEGLEQATRGECSRAADVFRELRSRHGVPR